MKTPVDIGDELLVRAKRHAKETGRPLRALVEDGLRLVLPRERRTGSPIAGLATPQPPIPSPAFPGLKLRGLIYGGPGTR